MMAMRLMIDVVALVQAAACRKLAARRCGKCTARSRLLGVFTKMLVCTAAEFARDVSFKQALRVGVTGDDFCVNGVGAPLEVSEPTNPQRARASKAQSEDAVGKQRDYPLTGPAQMSASGALPV
jgi:hypothetical protein